MYESFDFEQAFYNLVVDEDLLVRDIAEVIDRTFDASQKLELIKELCNYTGRDYEDFIEIEGDDDEEDDNY